MNYFEKHLGDYIKDTVSLSMLEDGAYNRLIDQCYQTEQPLPLDRKEIYRLARANSGPEKKAVDYVVSKFFSQTPEGFTQKRISAEITRYQDKQRKAKASADARWNKSKSDANACQTHDASNMRTHSDGNAHQAPVTRHQTPDLKPKANTATAPLTEVGAAKADGAGWSPGEISLAMRSAGVQSQPADPRIIALAEQGVSPETVAAACAEAKASKPNENIRPGYVVAIIERWAKEAASLQANGARPPSNSTSSKDASRAAAAASIGLGGQKNDIELNTIDGQFRAID